MPALFTSRPSVGYAAAMVSAKSRTACTDAKSAAMKRAEPVPAAVISSTTACPRSALRPWTINCAPCREGECQSQTQTVRGPGDQRGLAGLRQGQCDLIAIAGDLQGGQDRKRGVHQWWKAQRSTPGVGTPPKYIAARGSRRTGASGPAILRHKRVRDKEAGSYEQLRTATSLLVATEARSALAGSRTGWFVSQLDPSRAFPLIFAPR